MSIRGHVTVTPVFYSGSSAAPINTGTYAITPNCTPADTTDYNSLAGVSAGNFVINKATPTIALSSSLNPSKTGTSVTFTATPRSARPAPSLSRTEAPQLAPAH